MLTALRNFFDLNHEIVLFVYGQVFFVLGLAIALQSRRHSRLDLARSLRWLALFGLTHGFHEWGQLLIPIQATYLAPDAVAVLVVVRVALLAISFAVLFQFGVDLLRRRWPWLRQLPLLVTAAWTIAIVAAGAGLRPGLGLWEQWASISARYFIGFPAALVSAYGLRYQAERQIHPLRLGHIYRMLRTAGLALVGYAFFGGLVVPYGDFFPANVLNQSLLVTLVGIPVPVFRSIVGLVLAATIIRAMEVFDLEVDDMIEQMEIEQSLAAERERIGRELHDGAIQRVYTAGLIIESARHKVGGDSMVGQRLDRAMTALNEAIAGLRAYMTELRAEPVNVSLVEGLRQQAGDPRLTALMDVSLELELPDGPQMNPAQVTHVLAIVGEALSNAARHGEAQNARVRAAQENGNLLLRIEDDGSGFTHPVDDHGYGLRNMRDRARLLGGTLNIDSEPGRGTRVTLLAPWEEK